MKNSIRRNDDDGHDAQPIMKWSFRFKSFVIILKSYEIGFIDCLIGMRKKNRPTTVNKAMDGVDSSYSNTKYTFNEPILKVSISLWALFHFNVRRCVFLRHRFFSLLLSLSFSRTHTRSLLIFQQ